MLILFEAGGLHLRMAHVLDGEPASTSQKHALVLVGSPCARVRSGSCVTSAVRGRQSGVDLKPPQAAVDKSDSGERCESPPGDSTKATFEEGPFLAQSGHSAQRRCRLTKCLSLS
jgi:hypothetical protein